MFLHKTSKHNFHSINSFSFVMFFHKISKHNNLCFKNYYSYVFLHENSKQCNNFCSTSSTYKLISPYSSNPCFFSLDRNSMYHFTYFSIFVSSGNLKCNKANSSCVVAKPNALLFFFMNVHVFS